jgi:hypothetical protein
LNTKVVDVKPTYNFHKGNFVCHLIAVNRRYWPLGKFFTFFHSKFEMPIYMKVVSLNKLDNFHKSRFYVFSEFSRMRQKFQKTSRVTRV